MSKDAESWVWNHSDTSGNDRLVLLFLADQGDDDGTNSFPSVRRIADKCNINTATAIRTLGRLEQADEILIERPEQQGRGHFNRYTLVLGRSKDEVEALAQKGRDSRPLRQPRSGQTPYGKGTERFTTRAPGARLPTDPQTPSGSSSSDAYENDGAGARAKKSDERFDWQVPEVVASSGFLDAALELCDHWASRLEDRGVRAKERARSKTWVAPMEAMLRIDERDPLTARRVIDWLEDGRDEVATFWQGNVLSPDKLRAKWEQMGQQYRRQQTRRPESQHDRGRTALLDDMERNKP